jgi:hypothetical protein
MSFFILKIFTGQVAYAIILAGYAEVWGTFLYKVESLEVYILACHGERHAPLL